MKKTVISTAVAAVLGLGTVGAQAALVDGTVLDFVAATTGGIVEPASGSWFSMMALDLTLDGIPETNVYTPIGANNGVILGTTQLATGSHSGLPDGSEGNDIDIPWSFFTNTGLHQTTSDSTVLSTSGNTATVDLSGWNVTWNGIPSIPMGSGAWNGGADGVADVVCGVDCGVGDSFILSYSATVPLGDPSGFGGVPYGLRLEGTVAAVPVPAAVWLFGSGLLGLVGVARRKKGA